MYYLLLCIIATTLLVLIFKLYERFGIDNFQAIVVNYITAAGLGFILDNSNISFASIPGQSWFISALIIGLLFIALFNVIAVTTQKIGISVASVAAKMSLVVPVAFAVFLYGDSMSLLKVSGILLALFGVYLTLIQRSSNSINDDRSTKAVPDTTDKQARIDPDHSKRKYIFLPVILFLCSGFLDTMFKYTESKYLAGNDMNMFISTLFAIAAISGIVAVTYMLITGKSSIRLKNIIAGIILGLPNYGSVYFLLKTLEIDNFESSVIFPINNMGVVGLSAICAFLFFRERLSLTNRVGVGISILAIAMISLA